MAAPPSKVVRRPRRRRPLVGLCLGLAATAFAGTAPAEELLLGVEGNYTFNSNFFSAANNTDEANSFQLGPTLELTDPDGRFRYEIEFSGAYQTYADQDGVDAWESRLRTRVTYDLTERTRLQITDRFRDISNLRFSRQDIAVADTALDPTQDRYFRNDLELELIHDLAELVQLRLRGEHHWVDFDQNLDRNDSTAWDVGGDVRFQVATTHFLGFGGTYTRQDFEEALSRLGSTGEYLTATATWTWQIAENVTFTANGGPAWIRSDEDDAIQISQTQFVGGQQNGEFRRAQFQNCPTGFSRSCLLAPVSNPATDLGPLLAFAVDSSGGTVGQDDELTFFGGAAIDAALGDWNVQLTYQRRQSTTSGDGLASSLDRIYGEIEYAPPKYRWSVFLAGSWDRRRTLTDSTVIDFELVPAVNPTDDAQRDPGENAITSIRSSDSTRDNFTLIGGYRYRLDQNFAATLDGRYRRTEIDDPDRTQPNIDTFFVVLTFEYDLDPIEL